MKDYEHIDACPGCREMIVEECIEVVKRFAGNIIYQADKTTILPHMIEKLRKVGGK